MYNLLRGRGTDLWAELVSKREQSRAKCAEMDRRFGRGDHGEIELLRESGRPVNAERQRGKEGSRSSLDDAGSVHLQKSLVCVRV